MRIGQYLLSLTMILCFFPPLKSSAQSTAIRYVALGDSYTIGTGIDPRQAWPTLLTKHLQSKGVDVTLVANLAQAGWTSQEVLTQQIPQLSTLKPNFVTILIGANDWVQGVDKTTFANQFKNILDHLQKILPGPEQILVVTIPDFSVTPYAQNFGSTLNVKLGIAEFNAILTQEAQSRGLKVVDIFRTSQRMGEAPSLVSADGLHPSAKEHLIWEEQIFPVAVQLFRRMK